MIGLWIAYIRPIYTLLWLWCPQYGSQWQTKAARGARMQSSRSTVEPPASEAASLVDGRLRVCLPVEVPPWACQHSHSQLWKEDLQHQHLREIEARKSLHWQCTDPISWLEVWWNLGIHSHEQLRFHCMFEQMLCIFTPIKRMFTLLDHFCLNKDWITRWTINYSQ